MKKGDFNVNRYEGCRGDLWAGIINRPVNCVKESLMSRK